MTLDVRHVNHCPRSSCYSCHAELWRRTRVQDGSETEASVVHSDKSRRWLELVNGRLTIRTPSTSSGLCTVLKPKSSKPQNASMTPMHRSARRRTRGHVSRQTREVSLKCRPLHHGLAAWLFVKLGLSCSAAESVTVSSLYFTPYQNQHPSFSLILFRFKCDQL
ncbi:hypothetical protein EI94DRAFT_1713329, partial [Lactarius quietus]